MASKTRRARQEQYYAETLRKIGEAAKSLNLFYSEPISTEIGPVLIFWDGGEMVRYASTWECGAYSVEEIAANIAEAMTRPTVKAPAHLKAGVPSGKI